MLLCGKYCFSFLMLVKISMILQDSLSWIRHFLEPQDRIRGYDALWPHSHMHYAPLMQGHAFLGSKCPLLATMTQDWLQQHPKQPTITADDDDDGMMVPASSSRLLLMTLVTTRLALMLTMLIELLIGTDNMLPLPNWIIQYFILYQDLSRGHDRRLMLTIKTILYQDLSRRIFPQLATMVWWLYRATRFFSPCGFSLACLTRMPKSWVITSLATPYKQQNGTQSNLESSSIVFPLSIPLQRFISVRVFLWLL